LSRDEAVGSRDKVEVSSDKCEVCEARRKADLKRHHKHRAKVTNRAG
jgi:hypothetical protein